MPEWMITLRAMAKRPDLTNMEREALEEAVRATRERNWLLMDARPLVHAVIGHDELKAVWFKRAEALDAE